VGLMSGLAVRVTQPPASDQPRAPIMPYSRGLGPWLAWSGGSVVGLVRGRPVRCQVVLSSPSSRDACSKATPVYHPRG
jgi:hypothetical protein